MRSIPEHYSKHFIYESPSRYGVERLEIFIHYGVLLMYYLTSSNMTHIFSNSKSFANHRIAQTVCRDYHCSVVMTQ